jgi:hypothetical protein
MMKLPLGDNKSSMLIWKDPEDLQHLLLNYGMIRRMSNARHYFRSVRVLAIWCVSF